MENEKTTINASGNAAAQSGNSVKATTNAGIKSGANAMHTVKPAINHVKVGTQVKVVSGIKIK